MHIHKTPIHVRFRDLDAMGHVNNAEYFTYFAEARRFFFAEITENASAERFPFILAHIRCDFLIPVTLDRLLVVELWVKKVGRKSFHLGYRLVDERDAAVVFAKGESIQVCYDYEKQQPVAVPAELKSRLALYEASREPHHLP